MSDLIHRAEKSKMVAKDPALPPWQRLCQGLQAFSGLELSSLSAEVAEQFEAKLVSVNHLLAEYQLDEEEDYQRLDEADLQRILDSLDIAAGRAIALELERIISELDEGVGKLPVEAIQDAREHRDLMVPRLIHVLRDAISAARQDEVPEGNSHFFAVFLLTEFQAEEAFPRILEAFSLPGELPYDLFGDAVTSIFARILARFAGDRPDIVDALIRNCELNEYVRWEAAQSYVYCVRDGRLTRDEAVEQLRQHLRWAIDEEDQAITGGLICILESLAAAEALPEIEEAYERDLVDTFLVDLETVQSEIAQGEKRVRQELERCRPTGIEDTIEELRTWASFAEKPAPRPKPILPPPQPSPAAMREVAEPAPSLSASRGARVGRNDPCPCGSGKKFKKCCGSRGSRDM